jgi:RNA 3'-terminal phosphate cyclase (ATP)
MGPAVTAELERPGFYPAGGGLFRVEIKPAPRLLPLDLMERAPVRAIRVRVIVANLPPSTAQREINVVRRALSLAPDAAAVEEIRGAPGPGNAVLIEIAMEHHTEVFTGFGAPGVRAEAVAHYTAKQARAYLATGAPVGRYLADQLLLPLALAGGGRFRTGPLSRHTTTNLEVIRDFLKVNISVVEASDRTCTIIVGRQIGG